MKLKAGLCTQWSTTQVLKRLDYNVVTGINYNGLFYKLGEGRFDYFIRGVNEVFSEHKNIKEELVNQRLIINIGNPILNNNKIQQVQSISLGHKSQFLGNFPKMATSSLQYLPN